MRDLKFTDATPEQFRQFWEGEGWYGDRLSVHRNVKLHNLVFQVDWKGNVWLQDWKLPRVDTFGQALDALNELAGTQIMGGWA